MTLTRPQRVSLKRKWDINSQGMTYRAFRRSVHWGYECIMVRWCGMWVGIEKDGYAHT